MTTAEMLAPPLWRALQRGRIAHLDTWAGAPEVHAAQLEALADAIGAELIARGHGAAQAALAPWFAAEVERARQAR